MANNLIQVCQLMAGLSDCNKEIVFDHSYRKFNFFLFTIRILWLYVFSMCMLVWFVGLKSHCHQQLRSYVESPAIIGRWESPVALCAALLTRTGTRVEPSTYRMPAWLIASSHEITRHSCEIRTYSCEGHVKSTTITRPPQTHVSQCPSGDMRMLH